MNNRPKIVAANWKMNLGFDEAAKWLSEIVAEEESFPCEVLVFPSFVIIPDLLDLYEGSKLQFGAQNCSQYTEGAYTGEVSAEQIASIGVDYVIIGHSERRMYFGESNEEVKMKLRQALTRNIHPLFCCGEPPDVRKVGSHLDYVERQLHESLFSFSEDELSTIIIAYEPVWAIGSGENAAPEQAQEMHSFIRQQLAFKYSQQLSQKLPIIYGGSVKPDNARDLFTCPDVDGGLVGSASLNPHDFISIIKAVS